MRAIEKAVILPDAGTGSDYDPECRRCGRLAAFVDRVREGHPHYWCRPVPPFGPRDARLLVVGLAPGMHGANASGRAFTGDHAGILLYETLFDFGFATAKVATARDDGLALVDCRISNAVKCLPPDNRPLPSEVRECGRYLAVDLARLREGAAVIALGRVAHEAVLRILGLPLRAHPFAHGARHALDGARIAMFDSFHCSRYNTNTGRLTRGMFRDVFRAASIHLGRKAPP